jgi:hypothetical protein
MLNVAIVLDVAILNHFLLNAFALMNCDFFLTDDLNAISAAFSFFFLSAS